MSIALDVATVTLLQLSANVIPDGKGLVVRHLTVLVRFYLTMISLGKHPFVLPYLFGNSLVICSYQGILTATDAARVVMLKKTHLCVLIVLQVGWEMLVTSPVLMVFR